MGCCSSIDSVAKGGIDPGDVTIQPGDMAKRANGDTLPAQGLEKTGTLTKKEWRELHPENFRYADYRSKDIVDTSSQQATDEPIR